MLFEAVIESGVISFLAVERNNMEELSKVKKIKRFMLMFLKAHRQEHYRKSSILTGQLLRDFDHFNEGCYIPRYCMWYFPVEGVANTTIRY